MDQSVIKVFLVDDHQVLLAGLKLLLKDAPNLEIIGTACNGQDLLDQLHRYDQNPSPVDVILMDIDMEVMDGHEATKQVKSLYPEIKIIMLTRWDQMADINKAVDQGANGFLSKKNGRDKIVEAIFRVVHEGEFVVYTEFENEDFLPPPIKSTSSRILLTVREKQIISLICKELSIDEIATSLNISRITAQTHRRNILSKLGVNTNAGIVREAVTYGLCGETES